MSQQVAPTDTPRDSSTGGWLSYNGGVADSKLLTELFDTYSPLVLRRARRLMGNTHDAEEAVQEVFLRAMRHPEVFDDAGDVVGWFYRVTTNYCLNQLRNAKRRRELFEEHIRPTSPSRQRDEPDAAITMRWLLAQADERQARCASYVYFDDLTYDEVAELMGVSKRTVSNLMDRFKAWAKAELEKTREVEVSP